MLDTLTRGFASVARFAELSTIEPDAIAAARGHALELGAEPVSAAVGAQCAVIAATSRATSILEIGTGGGVAALWLLHGAPTATLTTIDVESEHLAAARLAFAAAGVPSSRTRLIAGRASHVLPRMNESSYDVVIVDADPEGVLEYVEHALRLIRPGGTVLVPRVLAYGAVADPVRRDDETVAYRSLIQETSGSPAVIAALSIVGEGLLQLTSPARCHLHASDPRSDRPAHDDGRCSRTGRREAVGQAPTTPPSTS